MQRRIWKKKPFLKRIFSKFFKVPFQLPPWNDVQTIFLVVSGLSVAYLRRRRKAVESIPTRAWGQKSREKDRESRRSSRRNYNSQWCMLSKSRFFNNAIHRFLSWATTLRVGPFVGWSIRQSVVRSVCPSVCNAFVSADRDKPANDLFCVYKLVLSIY